jgi:leucyl aminopeptidase (aminopeptidase T)
MSARISDAQADLLARRVLRERLHLRPKENVTIETYPSSLPWATAFVREARRLGARPVLLYEDEESYWKAVVEGRAALIGAPGEHEWAALEKTDAYVYFWGPEDQTRAARIPDATWSRLTAFNSRWYEVARKAGLRGARMGIARVTGRNARFWGVSESRWRREVYEASIRPTGPLRKDAARLGKLLENGRTVRLRHPNGTDLTLGLAGRAAISGVGEVTPESMKVRFGSMTSIPDANVYVAIDESTAEGRLVSNRVNSMFATPLVGGRMTFDGGRLREYSFARGGNVFRAAYQPAGAGKDRPSFVEIGLDAGIRTAPMLEESERGAVTVGVGRNAAFGGKTATDFMGYVTVGGGDLFIDDRPVVRGGRLL